MVTSSVPWRARASSCQEVGTTWFFSSCGGILELRRGSQPSPWVGPGKPNLPLGLRGKAGGRARAFSPSLPVSLCRLPEPNNAHPPKQKTVTAWSANCQSLPQAELFVRQRERPGLHSQAVAWPPRQEVYLRPSSHWLSDLRLSTLYLTEPQNPCL